MIKIKKYLFNKLVILFPCIWNFNLLSENINIESNTIIKLKNYNWNWYKLSKNPIININLISETLDKNWDWSNLSFNININDILTYPLYPWNMDIVRYRYKLKLDIQYFSEKNNILEDNEENLDLA